jgi:hypothetical protein
MRELAEKWGTILRERERERERERALQTKPYFYNCVTFEEGEEVLGILEGDEEEEQQQYVQLCYMV